MPSPTASSSGSGSAPRRYPVSDQFFKDAINQAIHDSLFSPITLGERHDVRLKPKFDTACWAYLPPHRIYVGTDLFEKRIVKEGLAKTQQQKYVANHYHHELGHALFTERDMSKIKRSLKSIEAPFPLYNLFEDAYMEDRYRREADYKFEWLTLEDLDFNPRPESLLFALIQAEGVVPVVEAGLKAWKPEPPKAKAGDPLASLIALFAANPDDTRATLTTLLPRVVEYYKRIIAVKESMHLMPILKAWLDEFGRPPQMPPGGAGGGMSDLEMSAELMTNPDAVEEFEADVESVTAGKDGSPDGGMKGKAQPKEDPSAVAKKGVLLHKKSTEVDPTRVDVIANKLLKFFQEKTRVISTRTPQRRISARHFALDRAPYRKKEIEGRGRKKVFIVLDCSGSMGGFHIMEGKILVAALSVLARRGYVEGHVALSGVTGGGPSWELYKLPMVDTVINRIQGYCGAEGLEYTMRDNLKLLMDADFAFVYTDAQICDRPIDKEFFHRYNIYTWGLYAGNRGDFMEEMLRYFDKAIMRDSADALVDAMLVQNK